MDIKEDELKIHKTKDYKERSWFPVYLSIMSKPNNKYKINSLVYLVLKKRANDKLADLKLVLIFI